MASLLRLFSLSVLSLLKEDNRLNTPKTTYPPCNKHGNGQPMAASFFLMENCLSKGHSMIVAGRVRLVMRVSLRRTSQLILWI